MTKILKWRLGKLPTVEELLNLLNAKLITEAEAKAILFSSETEEDRDKKSLESEIKFLRELIEKLSQDRTKVIEVIKEVYKPYYNYQWCRPYQIWCGTQDLSRASTTNAVYYGLGTTDSTQVATVNTQSKFSDIKTF